MKGEAPTVPEIDEDNDLATIKTDVLDRAHEFIKDQVKALGWDDMQKLVEGILRAMGYKTVISAPGPDRGKDIVATPDGLGQHLRLS